MSGFNGMLGVSFFDIETCLFQKMTCLMTEMMGRLLESLDALLFEARDKDRYRVKETKEGRIDTLFGVIEFKRRVYEDKKTGERVYGLDEALGLEKRTRISPGLKRAAVLLAVDGPSYRGARDSLKTFYGHQMISHEGIRQCTLKVGGEIKRDIENQRDDPQGKRKVKVLFIEADGMWIPRQRSKKKEERFAISYEGWRKRRGAFGEYELVGRMHCYVDDPKEDFWEEVSRQICATYDLSSTIVVINGDRAKWIRLGVKYFPKALYQFDRFHLAKDIKACLREAPEACKAALKALEENRPEEVLDVLRGVRLKNREAAWSLAYLICDLEQNPEAMVDYRLRLKAMGYDTTGMRGMGAAESNVNKFSRRLKRGRSWGNGLSAMMYALGKRFEGVLDRFTQRLEELENILDEKRLRTGAGHIVQEVLSDLSSIPRGHMPILDAGRNRSGGLSRSLRWLADALPSSLG